MKYTITQLANKLKTTRQTIYNLIKSGKIKRGNDGRIDEDKNKKVFEYFRSKNQL